MNQQLQQLLLCMKKLRFAMTYYPEITKIVGLKECIVLCQINYWTQHGTPDDGWVFKTAERLMDETGLTYKEQRTARKELVRIGILEEKYERSTHKLFFRLNLEAPALRADAHMPEGNMAPALRADGICPESRSYKEEELTEEPTEELLRAAVTQSKKEINTLSEGFWLSYPQSRRINKKETDKQAALALQRIADGESGSKMQIEQAFAFLKLRLQRYTRRVAKSEAKYIVHSHRWFKNSRYLDAPLEEEVSTRDVRSSSAFDGDEDGSEGNYSLTQDLHAEVMRQKRERDERAKARRS